MTLLSKWDAHAVLELADEIKAMETPSPFVNASKRYEWRILVTRHLENPDVKAAMAKRATNPLDHLHQAVWDLLSLYDLIKVLDSIVNRHAIVGLYHFQI